MSEKHTRCPRCETIYKVSQKQLTLSQGMVCCAKCDLTFNAITHLQAADTSYIEKTTDIATPPLNLIHPNLHSDVHKIFSQKIENSNLDLLTYLNNLKYFQNKEELSFPVPLLSNEQDYAQSPNSNQKSPTSWKYYLIWCGINILLFVVLLLQVIWFNPQLIQSHYTLRTVFDVVCKFVYCNPEQSSLFHVDILKLETTAINVDQTQFSGLLINHYSQKTLLPTIKVILKNQNDSTEVLIPSAQYQSQLSPTIKEINPNTTLSFNFTINRSINSFDHYRLELIQPES